MASDLSTDLVYPINDPILPMDCWRSEEFDLFKFLNTTT